MALKILLADDNITAQRLGAKILADAGHQVIAVSNGAAAVKKIASERPDLMILDVYMPGYSGLEVCAKVKSAPETAGLPVLLSVTSMEPFSAQEGNQARADGVMIKPFIASDLLAVIEKFERKLHAAVPVAAPSPAPSPAVEHDASYEEWKAEAAPEEEPQPAPVEVPHEMAAAPALGIEEMPVTPAPTHPAMVAAAQAATPEFGVEPAAFEAPAPVFGEAEAAHSGFEVTAEAVLPSEPAPPAIPAIETAQEITPPPELEYTAAQVGEIEIAPAPELELTIEGPSAQEPVIAQDPDLVTTPEEMAKFTTIFGRDQPEETSEDIVSGGEPAAEATVEPVGEVGAETPAEPVAEAGVDTVRLELVPEAVAEPEPETQPEAETGVDTVRLDVVPEPVVEPQPLQPIPIAATEGAPQPEPIAVAEAQPAPQPVQAAPPEPGGEAAPDEIEIEMPEELQPAFSVGASAAAVAPAREPEPQVAAKPEADEAADLVARFEAELEKNARPPEPESTPPEFEAEPPAAAALPAAAAVDQERLAAEVSAVLDRYLAGLKQEMVAAIVRELKK